MVENAVFLEMHDLGGTHRSIGFDVNECSGVVGLVGDGAATDRLDHAIFVWMCLVDKTPDRVCVDVALAFAQHLVTSGRPHPKLDVGQTHLLGGGLGPAVLQDRIAVVFPVSDNANRLVRVDH